MPDQPTHRHDPDAILAAYASGARHHPGGSLLAPDAAEAWRAVQGVVGETARLGAARVRDSARREWIVEARRDPARGRVLVFSPAHGDLEPFRASADGYRPDTHLPVTGVEWSIFGLLAAGREADAGRDDDELRNAAFRLFDRIVREAQHRQLLGAADDEDDA
jgi:hypothetical protein